jgi:hypothetical protein
MYYNDNQIYPTGTSLNPLVTNGYIASIGFTYVYTRTSDDSYTLTINLESGAGNEDLNSQTNCGISPQVDKKYTVCAK